MQGRHTTRILLMALAAWGTLGSFPGPTRSARADLVKLRSGGEIRGKLRRNTRPARPNRKKEERDNPVVVTTLAGTVIAVRRENVRFITRRSLRVEEYETRAKRVPNTVEDRWQLAGWCRQHGLQKQRAEQLRKILELNPEHRPARLALGYSKYNGRWMTRDEWNRSRGLVKYKGRYITPEELELLKKSQAELKREQEWFRRVRLWKAWLTSSNAKRSQAGLAELQKITDPDAVSALSRNFAHESNKALRRLFVGILSRMKGPKPVPALVARALHDSDYEIRYAALNAISEEQYAAALPYFIAALKNESVVVVRRAGEGLQRVGDERAVPALINALVTTHRYKVRVPDSSRTLSFGTNGSFAPSQSALPPQIELMLRAGQLPNGVIINNPQVNQMARTKVITVRYTHRNREVLAALERITGQSFGYRQRDWRLWLASSKNGAQTKSP